MADLRKIKKAGAARPAAAKPAAREPLEERPVTEPKAQKAAPQPKEAQAPASETRASPVPVAPASQPEQSDYDALMLLPVGPFFDVAKEKFAAAGITNLQELIVLSQSDREIALLMKAANDRNMLGSVLTFLSSPAPPEPGLSEPRLSALPGEPKVEHPSVYEPTVASDVGMAASAQPPSSPTLGNVPARPSKPPPPPPRRQSQPPPTRPEGAVPRKMDRIAEFISGLDQSSASPTSKLEQAKAFFDEIRFPFVQSIPDYSAKQDAWKRERELAKKEKRTPNFDEAGQKIERFMIMIHPLKSYIDNLQRCVDVGRDIQERKNGNGKPSDPPKRPSMPPQAPPRRPTPASLRQIGQAEEAARAQAPRQDEPKPGALKRFFTSYTTLAVAGAGVFGGAMAYNGRFADLAEGARLLAQRVSGAELERFPSWAAAAAYGAVMACALTISLVVQHSRKKRLRALSERQSRLTEEDLQRADMLVAALRKIREASSGGSRGVLLAIVDAMHREDGPFLEMYRFKGREVFPDILERAGIPSGLLAPLRNETIINNERVKMREQLKALADHSAKPADLRNAFSRMYRADELFRLMCDELFFQNVAQEYVNGTRAEDIFKTVKNSSGEIVGPALLEAMRREYPRISQQK